MNSGLEISALNLDIGVSNARSISGAGVIPQSQVVPQTSFADAVRESGMEVVNSLKNAEATSVAGLKGDAGPYQVASSMMEAEQALRMTTAIRDKIVAAYQEISRMQI